MYVNRDSAGLYQCVTWIGTAAMASVPAKLTIASISFDEKGAFDGSDAYGGYGASRKTMPPQNIQWRVASNNSILINCGNIYSNPAPVWSLYRWVLLNGPIQSVIYLKKYFDFFIVQRW